MKIAIGNDHVALEMKQEIAAFLKDMGHKVVDFGTDSVDKETQMARSFCLQGRVGNAFRSE